MVAKLLLTLLALGLGALARWVFGRFTQWEAERNAADITANGSQDNLRKGYHQRRSWARFWVWLGCCLPPALLLPGGPWAVALGFAALGLLLAGYFARWFTPALNVAMKLDYKPEYYCSPDSASWPDAAIWKRLRAANGGIGVGWLQPQANEQLHRLLDRVWLWCRVAAGVLALGGTYLLIVN